MKLIIISLFIKLPILGSVQLSDFLILIVDC